MHVRVDETGQHGQATEIDCRRAFKVKVRYLGKRMYVVDETSFFRYRDELIFQILETLGVE